MPFTVGPRKPVSVVLVKTSSHIRPHHQMQGSGQSHVGTVSVHLHVLEVFPVNVPVQTHKQQDVKEVPEKKKKNSNKINRNNETEDKTHLSIKS